MSEHGTPDKSPRSNLPFYLLGGFVVFVSGGLLAWSLSSAVFVKRQSPLVLNATQLSLAVQPSTSVPSSPSLALEDCSVVVDPSSGSPRVNCSNGSVIKDFFSPQVAGEQISADPQTTEEQSVNNRKNSTNNTFEDWILIGISVLASIWK